MAYRILQGDAREMLATLAEESVHCCVTSPPYWGLRDYGVDGQLGLEATPEEFTANMVEVFRAVHRVLRPDGTLWVNIGDSYSNATVGPRDGGNLSDWKDGGRREPNVSEPTTLRVSSLPPKNLVGIPWRLAFALQADGWYLRSDIIWAKPNPMPESISDRPTKAHEYLFLLSKRQRYYYDAEAIKERVSGTAHARGDGVNPKARAYKSPDGWDTSKGEGGHGTFHKSGREKGQPRSKQNASFSGAINQLVEFRNKRDVWEIASHPFAEAHFATFPPKLIEPCILAGSPVGGTVLDPFSGSGTTGMVALRHGRKYIGCELNPAYVEMSHRRICDDAPLFNTLTLDR